MKKLILFLLLLISSVSFSQIATLRYRYLSYLGSQSTISNPIVIKTSIDLYSVDIYETGYTIRTPTEVIGSSINTRYSEQYSKALRRNTMMFTNYDTYMIIDSVEDHVFLIFDDGSKFLLYNNL